MNMRAPLSDRRAQMATQDTNSDEFLAPTPWGPLRSRARDILQILPILALIGILAGTAYVAYDLIEKRFEQQEVIIQSVISFCSQK
jgi:hypothetical protein